MRLQARLFLALVGIGAVAMGAQWYLSATQGTPLTDVDTFLSSMKSVLLASAVIAGGMWLSIKALIPKKSI